VNIDIIEIERRIIGSILKDPSLYHLAEIIRYDDLQDQVCRDIWAALRSLKMRGTAVTLNTVAGSCMVASTSDIAQVEHAGSLNVDRLADTVANLIDNKRNEALIQDLAENLGKLRNGQPWREIIGQLMTRLVVEYDGHNSRNGLDVRSDLIRQLRMGQASRLPTGLRAVDEHFQGGLPSGFLIGLGAQTKTGKTALAATISGNWDAAAIPHLVYSLERRETHIEALKTARRLNMNMNRLADHLDAIEREAARSATYYVHNTRLTVEEWRHDVLHHVRRHNIKAVITDYFQLFVGAPNSGRKETREAELARTVQVIANTANDAGIPILLLSQNNDLGEPKDCKAIKQAAGYYGVIHRDQGQDSTYIETIATSISPFMNIGSLNHPAMLLDSAIGPHFRDE
jgi:replicative DNA helicase